MTSTTKAANGKAVCTAVAGIATVAALGANVQFESIRALAAMAVPVLNLLGVAATLAVPVAVGFWMAKRFPSAMWALLAAFAAAVVGSEYLVWYDVVLGSHAAENVRLTPVAAGLPMLASVLVTACAVANEKEAGHPIGTPERCAMFFCLLAVANCAMAIAVMILRAA